MVKKFKNVLKKTQIEVLYWKYAAWTLPFIALAILVFEHWIGAKDWFRITLITITTTFFTISVFWWWWAIHKILIIIEGINRTSENFEEIQKQLVDTKKDIHQTFGDD